MPKICEFENCRKYANYGEFFGNPLRCKYHKKEGMVNVKSKKCEFPDCKKIPNYNFEGETIGLFCSKHKKEGMVNVLSKKCKSPNCNTQPSYNFEGETIGLFCLEHKKEGMVNILSKKCKSPNCNIQPSYNYYGTVIGLFCLEHKQEGMIDILNKKCYHLGCNKRPTYNFNEQIKPVYCLEHKQEGMVDVKNKKCKANYCLGTQSNPKYKGYCSSCYQQLFPNDPLTLQIRSKTKEIAVRDFINLNFDGFQHDKPLWTGNCDCNHRRRIDHRKLIGNTLLCIETDENQHKGYIKDDEDIRYDDLYMLHGGKFIFIRFNPDKFKNKEGKNLNPMLYTRLPVLKKEIETQINRIENEENKELLEIIKLYYDE